MKPEKAKKTPSPLTGEGWGDKGFKLKAPPILQLNLRGYTLYQSE